MCDPAGPRDARVPRATSSTRRRRASPSSCSKKPSAQTVAEVERRVADELGGGRVRWGDELDIRQLDAHERREVAGYLAKYATKSTEQAGGVLHRVARAPARRPARPRARPRLHARGVPRSPADHRARRPPRLAACAHALGYRGHCLTKSRRYSTTFKALRQAREQHVHEQLLARSRDATSARSPARPSDGSRASATPASAMSQPPTRTWPPRRPRAREQRRAAREALRHGGR